VANTTPRKIAGWAEGRKRRSRERAKSFMSEKRCGKKALADPVSKTGGEEPREFEPRL
jgi:hypothetical protein